VVVGAPLLGCELDVVVWVLAGGDVLAVWLDEGDGVFATDTVLVLEPQAASASAAIEIAMQPGSARRR
jgi:hypothetical protein